MSNDKTNSTISLLVFLHMLVTWVDHEKSEEIQTPRYFKVETLSISVQLILILLTGMGACTWLPFSGYDHIFTLGWVE